GEVAERVEVDEVRPLERAGDAAIARTGKADHRRGDPEENGDDDRVFGRMTRRSRPGNPRDDTSQAAHTFPYRDHRSRDAMTDFECADGVHRQSLTMVQGACLAGLPAEAFWQRVGDTVCSGRLPAFARSASATSRRSLGGGGKPATTSTCADSLLPW